MSDVVLTNLWGNPTLMWDRGRVGPNLHDIGEEGKGGFDTKDLTLPEKGYSLDGEGSITRGRMKR